MTPRKRRPGRPKGLPSDMIGLRLPKRVGGELRRRAKAAGDSLSGLIVKALQRLWPKLPWSD